MVTVACPNCAKRLKAPDEAIGKKAKCTNCGRSFVLSAPPPLPSVEPAKIVLEPVDAPEAKRVPRWAVVALCCGGGVVLLVLVALVFARRNVTPLPQTSVSSPALAAAELPQKPPASAPSPPALNVVAPASPAPTTEAPETLEAELKQFPTLSVDKAIQAYSNALAQMRDAEDEYERRWVEDERDFHTRRDAEFKKRIPGDLAEAFKRMTDLSARHAWVVALSKMTEADRDAASAKDSEQRERVWELLGKFTDELSAGKIPAFNQASKPLKEQETKLRAIWVKVSRMEATLFPRMSREDLLEFRKWPAFDPVAEETKALQLSDKIAAILRQSGDKELDAWVPPELEPQLAMYRDSSLRFARGREIEKLADADAAREKDRLDEMKFETITFALSREGAKHSLSLTTRADLDATPYETEKDWHKVKATRYRARLKLVADALTRKSGD